MVVLCLLAALDNTFIVLKGSMTKTARVVFCSTLLDTISNFLRAHVKITGLDWQLVANYSTKKPTEIFYIAC